MKIDSQNGCLIHFDHGVWKHTAPPMSYDSDYWLSYVDRDNTKMGESLTKARVDFVSKHYNGVVVDIGIGGGRFVSEYGAMGFDVNESAIAWLYSQGKWKDPYLSQVSAVTCWDSLEHIPEPEKLLDNVLSWVFVSLPIFDSEEHIRQSKHYKPGEHIWYFTDSGFKRWLGRHGFIVVEQSDIETRIGREGIITYAAMRA